MTTHRHHIIFDTDAIDTRPYTLAEGSTDSHAEGLRQALGGLRVERTEVTVISTPSTAVGRAPFSDWLKEAQHA